LIGHIHITANKLYYFIAVAVKHLGLYTSSCHQETVASIAVTDIYNRMSFFHLDCLEWPRSKLIHPRKVVHTQVRIGASHRKTRSRWIHRQGGHESSTIAIIQNVEALRHWY
jgi:hypothetical protein